MKKREIASIDKALTILSKVLAYGRAGLGNKLTLMAAMMIKPTTRITQVLRFQFIGFMIVL
jgi:hypothetical protein